MELKKAILFAIYERTAIKGRSCSIFNILQHISSRPELREMDPEEIKDEVVSVAGELLDKGTLGTFYNPRGRNDGKICFEITPEKFGTIVDLYRENILERIAQLDDEAKALLYDIYDTQVVTHLPYILDELTPESRTAFDASIDKLMDLGFASIKDSYNYDGDTLYCDNAILTISGKEAYNQLEQSNNYQCQYQ